MGAKTHRRARLANLAGILALLLLSSLLASAQLELGENWKMTLSGNVGYGYGGSYGNIETSNHSQGFSAAANLDGYYFNPNFISFNFRPYFDRNQSNADSQTITRGTGLGANAMFFGGSHFPGSISFSKDFSSNSEFQIAGVPTVSADSTGQTLGISWSALVPRFPTLTAAFSMTSGTANVLGLESHSSSKNLSVNSAYRLLGWDLHGTFSHNTSDFTVPAFLTVTPITGGGTSNGYGISAGHPLPLRGSFGVSASHTSFDSGTGTDWSSTYYTVTNSFMPLQRLTVFQNFNYTTNLTAAFAQTVTPSGTVANLATDAEAKGLSYSAGASFVVGHGLNTGFHFTHRVQWLMGQRYQDTQYGGNLSYNYASRLFGMLYFGFGMVDTASKQGNEGIGFNATVGMNRRIGRWETSADFNYYQNVQTLVVLQTSSSYMYGASVKRKVGHDLRWSSGFRGSRSAIVLFPGTGNSGESISTTVNWRQYNLSGTYSQSQGVAVFGANGEVLPTPVGPLFTDQFILFNGKSWSVGAGAFLLRRLSVSGGYAHFTTNTLTGTKGVFDGGNHWSARAEYRLRRFSLSGAYSHSYQVVSSLGLEPHVVNSYYASVSRWFNVF